ncbi:MAG: polysaccharide deacetylase family protein [Dehalococcoidia bacterium]
MIFKTPCRGLAIVALFLLTAGLAGLVPGGSNPDAPAAVADSIVPRLRVAGLVREGYPGTVPYTVKQGDTLYSIAARFQSTVATIAALNGIADPTKIEAGWTLYVPDVPAPPPGPSVVVRNGDRTSNVVALTFDMGGRLDPALDIVNWLVANNVHATIFPTGAVLESTSTDVARQVLAVVSSRPDLFEIGNHSYDHPDFTTISAAAMKQQLQATEAAVARVSSMTMKPRFRPPFGAYDAAVLDAVGAAGYGITVMWDVDTIDWRPEGEGGPTRQQIIDKVLNNARGGSIVLMHLGGYNTLEALPAIVAGLRARGYEPGTVSEVLGD